MKSITLAKTKELLGITGTASDADITAKIPFIDAIVKQITKNRFNFMILGNTTADSAFVRVYSIITYAGYRYDYQPKTGRYFYSGINNNGYFDDINDYLEIGQQIEGTGIPAETYIDEVFYNGDLVTDNSIEYTVPTIKMSANATATAEAVRIYVGMNIAYQSTVAKGIQFLIDGTSSTLPTNTLSSKSIGPASKSFADSDQKMNHKYGMPGWFVKAFPTYVRGH